MPSSPPAARMLVHYRVQAVASEIESFASMLALEQSVEVPIAAVRDAWVMENIVGDVEEIVDAGNGSFDVRVALATATTGFDCAQTINMLFGNASLHERVELVDVDFPPELVASFPGPRFGIAGLRERTRTHGRPLTCSALKPQGLPAERLAALCRTFALAGVDVIKDDHGIADQAYSPFVERVRACQQAVDAARRETGRSTIYAPSIVGSPRVLAERLRIAQAEGVGMVLLAPALIGMPVFVELVREHLEVPVLAHPSYAGAARVAPPFVLGKLFRLLGADAVIFPSHGGRFAYSPATCTAIAETARRSWHDVSPCLPVPAGGMTVERVPELVRFYGHDSMLLIGGSLLAADDVSARTREFVQKVEGSTT